MTTAKDIPGLHEQIIANAIVLYRQEATKHQHQQYETFKAYIPLADAFSVTVSLVKNSQGDRCAQASLRCNVRVGDSVLLKGQMVDTHGMHFTIHTIDALESLLQTTAARLGERESGP